MFWDAFYSGINKTDFLTTSPEILWDKVWAATVNLYPPATLIYMVFISTPPFPDDKNHLEIPRPQLRPFESGSPEKSQELRD